MEKAAAKKEIRKKILGMRRALQEHQVRDMSRMICDSIRMSDVYRAAEDICLYMPINNEVDVPQLAGEALCDGKRLWLPRVDGDSMDFFRYDENTQFDTGSYNIREPQTDEMLTPGPGTLIVMPGAVFSESRDRIGYGGGYYDRYLRMYPECSTLAVCYDFQILDDIPSESHDRKPDVIVSEKRMITG